MPTESFILTDAAGHATTVSGSFVVDGTPPLSNTGFGFNIWSSWDGYSPGTTETSAQLFARLKRQGFPAFDWAKAFNPNFVPTTWSKSNQGERDLTNPAKNFLEMFNWTPGTIADKSKDAWLTTYFESVEAAGVTAYYGRNEPDNNKVTGSQWPLYVADMNRLFDIKKSLSLSHVKVADCFMDWSLDPLNTSGQKFSDSWTNPAKRDAIIFDKYWNKSTVDKSGMNGTLPLLEAKAQQYGLDWILGETGDRKPGTKDSTEPSDATRAVSMKTRYSAVLSLDLPPIGILWFDVVGSTGNHTMQDEDVATRAQWASLMSQ